MYVTAMQLHIFQPSVNIGNVNKYLSDSNRDISQNASRCKEFIQKHMDSNKPTGPPNMATLMAFINQKMGDKQSEVDLNNTVEIPLSQNVQNEEKENNEEKTNNERKERPNLSRTVSFNLECVSIIKQYVDIKILELEDKVMNRVDELQKNQDEKFNEILTLLQKK